MAGLASNPVRKQATRRASVPAARRREIVIAHIVPPPLPHRFTVEDYYRMGETGILKENSRVELIEGEIVMMPPIDPGHAEGTHQSERRMDRLLEDKFDVRCQHPVRLSSISEPVPDVSVVKAKSYEDGHPTAHDTLLILEVANSSLREDLSRKKLMDGICVGSKAMFAGQLKALSQPQLRPIIDSTFTLETATEAFQRMESAQHVGKIVIKI